MYVLLIGMNNRISSVFCEICHRSMKVLNSHVLRKHGLRWAEYKQSYPMARNAAFRSRISTVSRTTHPVTPQKFYRHPWSRERVEQMIQWWPHFGSYAMALRLSLPRKTIKSKANSLHLKLLPDSERLCIECLKPGHWERHLRCHACSLLYRQKHRSNPNKPFEVWVLELLRTARYRSKQQCNITLQHMTVLWADQNSSCFYCGDSLHPSDYGRRRDRHTASIDRLDSSKGYLQGNVAWSCWGCNWMKSKMTVEEFVTKCSQVARHRGIRLLSDHDKVVAH